MAFDYAKCTNKLSGASHEKEKKGARFFREFELEKHPASKYTFVVELFHNATTKTPFTQINFHWGAIRWFIDY